MKTKLIETTSVAYAKRMAKEITEVNSRHGAPYFKLGGSAFDGRRIMHAWVENGVLMGRSLNGESFPMNAECIYDGNGEQVCASRIKG